MYIDLNDEVRLHYTETGTKDVLILLHGNNEDILYFENQISFFSKLYRVIAIDTRGHGKSERGSKPFNIRQFADDLYEFMEMKSINKAHILGFSDGANIAMVFAINYPDKVNKLILNGGNLDKNGLKAYIRIPIIAEYKLAVMLKNKKREEMLGLMVNDPQLTADDLKKIKSRTLVIAGKRDMIKGKHTTFIYENISDAKLSIISGNHFIAQKKSDVFNMEILRFLGE